MVAGDAGCCCCCCASLSSDEEGSSPDGCGSTLSGGASSRPVEGGVGGPAPLPATGEGSLAGTWRTSSMARAEGRGGTCALPATRGSACPAGGCSSSHLHYTRGSPPPPSLTAGDPCLPYSYSLLQRNTLREYWRCLLSPAGCHPRWLAPCPSRPHHSTHGARQASQASGGGWRGGGRRVALRRAWAAGGRRLRKRDEGQHEHLTPQARHGAHTRSSPTCWQCAAQTLGKGLGG